MEIGEFYSYGLNLKLEGGGLGDNLKLLFPSHNEKKDFNPFNWIMKILSSGECFTYKATRDSKLHIVFPENILSASFEKVTEGEEEKQSPIYNGVVCYPHILCRLKNQREELAFSFPDIGE